MKQTFIYCFLVIVLLGSAEQLNAQTEKGKILLGGQSSMAFSAAKTTSETNGNSSVNTKTKQFDITPQVAYFIVNNLAIGLIIPYIYTKETLEDYSSTMNGLSVSPFAIYYFGKTKIKPYLIGSIGPGWGKSTMSIPYLYDDSIIDPNFNYDDLKKKVNYFSYSFGGGMAFYINNHVAIDLGVGYSSVNTKWKDKINLSYINKKLSKSNIGAQIGIVVCL